MSHAQHWPELNPAVSRLKIFLAVFFGLVLVSLVTFLWRGVAGKALLQNTSLGSPRSEHAKVIPPIPGTKNFNNTDDSGQREADFLVYMGDEMFRRGDLEGAVAAFQKAVEQSPTSEQIHLKLALCHMRLNRTESAIASLNEAIHIAPDFAEAHHQMGLVLMQAGKLEDATDHFVELTHLRPTQASAFNGLGLVYARQKKFAKASTNFIAALRLNPRYLEARYNLSQVYTELGAFGEAAAELDRSLQINPQFQPALLARERLTKTMPQSR
ncbi:MAG TPA: tetratricopeptide repeat protein [Candidatus Kapabacteria bacterium]|nr:tetratricopeptide repeat protein [Candidatus Kapabacteria bacterium]